MVFLQQDSYGEIRFIAGITMNVQVMTGGLRDFLTALKCTTWFVLIISVDLMNIIQFHMELQQR